MAASGKQKNSSNRRTETLSRPFKSAIQSFLRHKYPTEKAQKDLAKIVDRPYPTVKGFIYNGVGGGDLQHALLAVGLGLKTPSEVEDFIEQKLSILLTKAETTESAQISPSVALFSRLFNETDEELLHFLMQSVALNVGLAQDLGLSLSPKQKKINLPTKRDFLRETNNLYKVTFQYKNNPFEVETSARKRVTFKWWKKQDKSQKRKLVSASKDCEAPLVFHRKSSLKKRR